MSFPFCIFIFLFLTLLSFLYELWIRRALAPDSAHTSSSYARTPRTARKWGSRGQAPTTNEQRLFMSARGNDLGWLRNGALLFIELNKNRLKWVDFLKKMCVLFGIYTFLFNVWLVV